MTSASEWERCNPEKLRQAERLLLGRRRPAADPEQLAATVAVGKVGIGLSGGGIRSATQSLGFFQALSRVDLLPHVDYLSTVSGGGYFMIGTVISADMDLIGQMQPNTPTRFVKVTMDDALKARTDRARLLGHVRSALD